MIHDPCDANPTALCIREGKFFKNFPKPFRSETVSVEGNYYVSYRRRSPKEGVNSKIGQEKVR